ncbi:MAG: sugar phosphate isomerase/epimerase [Lentisphaeria bacterium]|nr:sugar phosphate isomerase/epimerase [Lentisphaeria bacterium]
MAGHLLNYYYPFQYPNDPHFKSILREFLDWGVNSFVFTVGLAYECAINPESLVTLRGIAKEFGVTFHSMHAPYGREQDLDIPPHLEDRKAMFDLHRRAMGIAAEFGCKTYTMHVGASHYVHDRIPAAELVPWAKNALETLLPTAEKLGIVIAVENSFEGVNSPDVVLDIIKDYVSSPSIGLCYDTGHANILAPFPGKQQSLYESYMPGSWWETGIVEEAASLDKMAPYVVTCHIHDNNGYGDLHGMPFDGCVKWDVIMPKLFACPRMLEFQSEVCFDYGTNWAGKLLAPVGGYSIKRYVETFRKLGFN